MKLTKHQAKCIVRQVMGVIPYNINIMNERGIIIGSGDINRLNKVHEGALEALKKGQSIEIYKETKYVKPGINIPIFFKDIPIGVIGITGEPDIVRPFGELVRAMAELLVNQDYILNQQNVIKQQKEEYLYELAYKTNPYTKKFIERGLFLGIDISIPRVAVVLHFESLYRNKIESRLKVLLRKTEYYLAINPENIVLFIHYENSIINRIKNFIEENKDIKLRIGIGRPNKILAYSLNEGIKALELGARLEKEKSIHKYEDLYFFSTLFNLSKDQRFVKLNELLQEGSQADLLNTLINYIKFNGQVNKIAEALHIHRNTLNYRLEKIKELTGKDPYNYRDLLELFIAYMAS